MVMVTLCCPSILRFYRGNSVFNVSLQFDSLFDTAQYFSFLFDIFLKFVSRATLSPTLPPEDPNTRP
jgi:hypothetical protein